MSRRALLVTVEIAAPIMVLVIWQVLSVASESFYFPPLSEILISFWEVWVPEGFLSDAVPSILRMFAGYLVAVVVGIALGLCLGLVTWLRRATTPLVEFARAVPPVALIPFGIVVFGVGDPMKIFVIAIGSLFPVLLNTIDGARSVEPTLRDVTSAFRLTRWQRLASVVLPSASPQIFAGMRSSLAIALILMVVSEMVGSTNGIGYFVLESQRLFSITEMWSGIVLLGVLGYLLNVLLVSLEKRVLAWHRGFRASVMEAGAAAAGKGA